VLLILTDDQGYGDIGSHGNDKIRTPNLDKLAAPGARFERFFVSPLCAPTRAALLTGRYFHRSGVSGVCKGAEVMGLEEATVAGVLKAAGYATGCFGKWHNGENYPFHPNGKGFDQFYGFCGGHWDNFFDTTLDRNGRPEKMAGYITDVLTDEAMQFIENSARAGGAAPRPFFCYVPYNAPHDPMQVPQKYLDAVKQRGLEAKTAAVYAMVECVDQNVGRLLDKLDELRIADNTIVIFLTDNGPNGRRFNDGMAGIKGSNLEGGCRVPCFLRWPKAVKPGTVVKPIAAHIDILPTLAAACGVHEPKTLPLDGLSLLPLLGGAGADWPDRKLFETGAVRTQRWRLQTGGKGGTGLYDMRGDPGQKTDVAGKNADVVRDLSAAYAAWDAAVKKDAATKTRTAIPVGHAESPATYLTAHRATARDVAATVPWTSAWLKWTSPKGEAQWDIDVVADGRYEAALLALCPKETVGAKLRVEAGGAKAEGTLDREHYPDPMAGRTYANARPEMAWVAYGLGTLELEKGRTKLKLSAVELPGGKGFEAKGLRLTALRK
jgi:arylsulfatase A